VDARLLVLSRTLRALQPWSAVAFSANCIFAGRRHYLLGDRIRLDLVTIARLAYVQLCLNHSTVQQTLDRKIADAQYNLSRVARW
jgi:hypothetical protein